MKCDYTIQLNYKGVKREFIIPSLDTEVIKEDGDVLSHVSGQVHSFLEGNGTPLDYVTHILNYMRDVDNGLVDTNPQLKESVNNFINDKGIDFNTLRNHVSLSANNKYAPLIKELITPITDGTAPGIHFALRDQIDNESNMKTYSIDDLAKDNKNKIVSVKFPKYDKGFKATVTGETDQVTVNGEIVDLLQVKTSTGKIQYVNPTTEGEVGGLIGGDKLNTQVEDTKVAKSNRMVMAKHIYDRVADKSKIMLYVDKMPTSLDILRDESLGKALAHELTHFRIDRNVNEAEYDSDKKQFTNPDYQILSQMKDFFAKEAPKTNTYKENSALRDVIDAFTSQKATTLEANEKHNLREFVAYATSEPIMKQAMNEIAVKGLPDKESTLLDVLTGWTAKSLDISPKNKSLLSSFHNVLVDILDVNKNPEEVYYDAKKDDVVREEKPVKAPKAKKAKKGADQIALDFNQAQEPIIPKEEAAPESKEEPIEPEKPVIQADTFYKPFTNIERLSTKAQTFTITDAIESEQHNTHITAEVTGYQLRFEGHPNIDTILMKDPESNPVKWMVVDKKSGLQVGGYKGTNLQDIFKNVISNLNSVMENNPGRIKAMDELRASTLGDSYNPRSKNTQSYLKSTDSLAHVRMLSDRLSNLYQLNFRLLNSRDIANIYDSPERKYSLSRAFLNGSDIVINTDLASMAEPLHEVAHVVLAGVKNTDPELYQSILSTVQSHPRYNDIASSYPELSGDDLNEEVFATVFGENYRNVLKSDDQKLWENNNKGWFAKIIDNVKNFFKNLFGIQSPLFDKMESEEVSNLSLEDIIGKFGDKLLEGSLKNYVDDYNKAIDRSTTDFKQKLKENNILNVECYA